MPRFYVTFGQKSPFRFGWVCIEADDLETARMEAHYTLGESWSMIYSELDARFAPELFPDGHLGRPIKLPVGYKHHRSL